MRHPYRSQNDCIVDKTFFHGKNAHFTTIAFADQHQREYIWIEMWKDHTQNGRNSCYIPCRILKR